MTKKEKLIEQIQDLANELILTSNDLFQDKKEEIIINKEIIEVENCVDVWSEKGTIKISKIGGEIHYLIPYPISGYDLDLIKQKYWSEINDAINFLNS
jgi:hypothetical protein